jgi:uncharacterized protein YecE (DUF72 family)
VSRAWHGRCKDGRRAFDILAREGVVRIRIGTSGWHYEHWRGVFYPPTIRPAAMLPFYARHFDAVELNSTFYRLAAPGAAARWRTDTPDDFLFAAKGSRFITHMKKLSDPAPALARYFEALDELGSKLGPIVFQLPPNWPLDLARLEAFMAALPPGHRYAFEFRDPSWHVPPVYALLRRYDAAFCLFDLAGFTSPFEITAEFTYVRLHGPGGPYQGSYTTPQLRAWARRLGAWTLETAYVFFDNDQAAYATKNAATLRSMLEAGN